MLISGACCLGCRRSAMLGPRLPLGPSLPGDRVSLPWRLASHACRAGPGSGVGRVFSSCSIFSPYLFFFLPTVHHVFQYRLYWRTLRGAPSSGCSQPAGSVSFKKKERKKKKEFLSIFIGISQTSSENDISCRYFNTKILQITNSEILLRNCRNFWNN